MQRKHMKWEQVQHWALCSDWYGSLSSTVLSASIKCALRWGGLASSLWQHCLDWYECWVINNLSQTHSRLQIVQVQAKSCLKQVHRKVVSRFADSKHQRLKFNNISYRRLLNSPQDVHLAQAHAKAARCSSCPRRGVVGGLVADAFFRWTLIV